MKSSLKLRMILFSAVFSAAITLAAFGSGFLQSFFDGVSPQRLQNSSLQPQDKTDYSFQERPLETWRFIGQSGPNLTTSLLRNREFKNTSDVLFFSLFFFIAFLITMGVSSWMVSPVFLLTRSVKNYLNGNHIDTTSLNVNGEVGVIGKGFLIVSNKLAEISRRSDSIQQQLDMANMVCHHSSEGILYTDSDTRIIWSNPAFCRILGYSSAEIMGKTLYEIFFSWHKDRTYENVLIAISEKEIWQGTIEELKKNGEKAVLLQSFIALRDKQKLITNYIGIFQDITEKKLAEARAEKLAYYDPLTGLPNRTLFNDRFIQNLEYSSRNNLYLALLIINVDDFSKINDTYGHHYGDRLLKTVAARLNSVLRKSDTNSHMGGDEFTIILNDIKDYTEAGLIAQRCIQIFTQPILLDNEEFFVTLSIGISFYPDDGTDVQSLLMKADTALNHAKDKGKNNFQFYTERMNHDAMENLKLETQLHNALKYNELSIYYQPQIDDQTRKITGVEALLRWKTHDGKFISPTTFIPIAEKTGLIMEIGSWVFENACLFCKRLEDNLHQGIRIAVNFSIRQLKDSAFVQKVKHIINKTGVNTALIEIEITESLFMEDIDNCIHKLTQLKEIGLSIAIDDFGTGYSSMGYLCQLPLDKLKIDKSFVDKITSKDGKLQVIQTIISMGHNLSLKVIAEGVENEEQVKFLKENECNEYQGFYFGKPMPEQEFYKLIEKGPHFT